MMNADSDFLIMKIEAKEKLLADKINYLNEHIDRQVDLIECKIARFRAEERLLRTKAATVLLFAAAALLLIVKGIAG